jgi:hypothetical protein
MLTQNQLELIVSLKDAKRLAECPLTKATLNEIGSLLQQAQAQVNDCLADVEEQQGAR